MFNVTVIDGKRILKYMITVITIVIITVLIRQITLKKGETLKSSVQKVTDQIYSNSFLKSVDTTIASARYLNNSNNSKSIIFNNSFVGNILDSQLNAKNKIISNKEDTIDDITEVDNHTVNDEENNIENNIENNVVDSKISENIVTQVIDEKNIKATYTNSYENVEIKNKSGYKLTDDMLVPDITLENKQDIIIFHTHACESYTPSEGFNYQMTGNYRTTDLNYNVTRVGTELENHLKNRGYNVIHDTTLNDYPSYSGSYDNSMRTVKNILNNSTAQLIIDLHRDAVGSGSDYGPTVKINDEVVAQLMIVVGTNAGGLEHPNWRENLKFAVKLQAKGNELYPGLFRPINLSTARYNQNLSKGALIIEVGATANTMEQCLGSMKYLASVIDEVMQE